MVLLNPVTTDPVITDPPTIYFLFQVLNLESGFLSVAYLMVTNLARLGMSVYCQVSVVITIIIVIINRFYLTHSLYMVLRSNITFTQFSHTDT